VVLWNKAVRIVAVEARGADSPGRADEVGHSGIMNPKDTIETAFDGRTLAVELFDTLRTRFADAEGVTRESLGAGEEEALGIIRTVAEAHGLTTETDAAANLVISLPGRENETPFVACGSHIDTVPQGGNFDGAAGVVAGLVCLCRMRAEGIAPKRNVKLIVLRGEESAWYGKACVGSHALFGMLAPEDLASVHRKGTATLGDALARAGADVKRIEKGERLLDPGSVAAFLELHIEQGPVMVERDLPTAIVTGIRGNVHHLRMVCRGEAGHSGVVPRWLRHDAVFAASELISNLDEHWRVLLEHGHDLVVTVGTFETDAAHHSVSRIPGEVAFSFEVRSQSTETLQAFYELMRTECRQIEIKRKVRFEFDRRIDSPPARVDPRWVDRLSQISRELDLPTETIPSGAGHDAGIFATAGVPAAMIFIRNHHGSHNPHEDMDIEDFLKGTELLFHALVEPVS
jgi:N-carbamoyl-L-amino-acid hydrolase